MKEITWNGTKLRTKRIAMLLWLDLARNGYMTKQESKYYYLVKNLKHNCPFCELYHWCNYENTKECNTECPMKDCRTNWQWLGWVHSKTKEYKKYYAWEVYFCFNTWKVKE